MPIAPDDDQLQRDREEGDEGRRGDRIEHQNQQGHTDQRDAEAEDAVGDDAKKDDRGNDQKRHGWVFGVRHRTSNTGFGQQIWEFIAFST